MRHLIKFESYSPKDEIVDTSMLHDLLKSYNGSITEKIEAYVNDIIKSLTKDMDKPEYGLVSFVDEIAKDYVNFISMVIEDKGLDLSEYYKKESERCKKEPFELSDSSDNGKAFLKEKDAKINWEIDRAKTLLVELVQSKEETAFTYFKDSKKVCNKIKKIENTEKQKRIYSIISFIMFTYDKLRPLFKTAKDTDMNGSKLSDKPSIFSKVAQAGKSVIGGIGAAAGALVVSAVKFVSQGSDSTGCFRACLKMVGKPAPPHLGIKMAKESGSGHIKLPTFDKGLDIINKTLEKGEPIIVGVDDKKGSVNHDQTTDHFVVIVGRGQDNNGSFYQFYDPGTSHAEKGTDDSNRFYMDSEGLLSGTSAYNRNSKHYTLSWVRPTA